MLKVKVLKSLRQLDPQEVKQNFVRGQYDEGFVEGEKSLLIEMKIE